MSGRLAAIVSEALGRCDEAAAFTEEHGKVTRHLPQRADAAAAPPARHLDGSRPDLRVRVDAAGNLLGRYHGLRPGRAGAADRLAHRHGTRRRQVRRRAGRDARHRGRAGPRRATAAVRHRRDRVQRGRGRALRRPVSGQPGGRRQIRSPACSSGPTPDGIAMADAFRAFGLDPSRIAEAAYPAGGLLGYLEVHIEQGPVLESLGAPVGVVEAIAGQSRIRARDPRPGGTRRDLADGGPARCAGGRRGARPRGRAARPIGRRPARDGRHDRGRAGRIERRARARRG